MKDDATKPKPRQCEECGLIRDRDGDNAHDSDFDNAADIDLDADFDHDDDFAADVDSDLDNVLLERMTYV